MTSNINTNISKLKLTYSFISGCGFAYISKKSVIDKISDFLKNKKNIEVENKLISINYDNMSKYENEISSKAINVNDITEYDSLIQNISSEFNLFLNIEDKLILIATSLTLENNSVTSNLMKGNIQLKSMIMNEESEKIKHREEILNQELEKIYIQIYNSASSYYKKSNKKFVGLENISYIE